MAFSVSKFRSTGLVKGGARPNLFEVLFVGADAAPKVKEAAFSYLCKIASIPPSTMGVVEVPYFGRMVKVPGNRTFDNLSLTVINDEDMILRNSFEGWMNKMNTHVGNVSNQPDTLLGSIQVRHYVRGDVTSLASGAAWNFINVFPVALGEIALDWSSNDTIEEFTVDFAYDYWTHGEHAA